MNNQEVYDLVIRWKGDCIESAKQHGRMGRYLKKKYKIFGMAQLIIPIGFTLAVQLIQDPLVNSTTASIGFALSAVTTVTLNFLNFSILSVKHEQADNSYTTLVNHIESTMSSQHYASDILVTRVRTEMKNLLTYSPGLDDDCISDRCCGFLKT